MIPDKAFSLYLSYPQIYSQIIDKAISLCPDKVILCGDKGLSLYPDKAFSLYLSYPQAPLRVMDKVLSLYQKKGQKDNTVDNTIR